MQSAEKSDYASYAQALFSVSYITIRYIEKEEGKKNDLGEKTERRQRINTVMTCPCDAGLLLEDLPTTD